MSEIVQAVEQSIKELASEAVTVSHLLAGAEKLEATEAIAALEHFQKAHESANRKPHGQAAELLATMKADEKGCPGK